MVHYLRSAPVHLINFPLIYFNRYLLQASSKINSAWQINSKELKNLNFVFFQSKEYTAYFLMYSTFFLQIGK